MHLGTELCKQMCQVNHQKIPIPALTKARIKALVHNAHSQPGIISFLFPVNDGVNGTWNGRDRFTYVMHKFTNGSTGN